MFTALGFYPVAPGSGEHPRPSVPARTAMRLPNGKTFTIVAEGWMTRHTYVGSVSLNGKPLQRTFLRHDEIWPAASCASACRPSRTRTGRAGRAGAVFDEPVMPGGADHCRRRWPAPGRRQPWLARGRSTAPTKVGVYRNPPARCFW
jgi:hypothetical protein